uniref:Leucine rich immune protein (Coil-less) n=1 Tax=Anopheles culicifacies TaxID=139723 RepID=A0A182LVT9_9DIPT
MECVLRLVIILLMYATSSGASHGRRCLAGSEVFVCVLPRFDYQPGQDIPMFELPADVNAIRFVEPLYNIHETDNTITVYDGILHRQLNSPKAVELTNSYTSTVYIPPNLEYADFSDNIIEHLHVPVDQSYALRYLDLNSNFKLQVQNVSRLVNLETLHLSSCSLEQLPLNMFENLNRLAHLTLAGNNMHTIDLDWFPMSLTLLRLDQNWMKEFHFSGSARLPLLEDLNIEYNDLTTLDIKALVETVPKLRLFSIGRNPLKRNELEGILEELNRRNIAYYNMEHVSDQYCNEGERMFRGVCISDSVFALGWGEWFEILFFIIVMIALAIGLAFAARFLWNRYHVS